MTTGQNVFVLCDLSLNFYTYYNYVFFKRFTPTFSPFYVYGLNIPTETKMDYEKLVGIKELASILNVSEKHIRKLLDKGALPYHRFGAAYRFDVEKVLKHTEVKPSVGPEPKHDETTATPKYRISKNAATAQTRQLDPVIISKPKG